jgi:dTDP-4-dehydrorhamnose 3,5-epimerase
MTKKPLGHRHCSVFVTFGDSRGNLANFTMLLGIEIIRTPIEDLIIFRPTSIRDERGHFSRTLDVQILTSAGIDPNSFKQENHVPTRVCAADFTVEQGMVRRSSSAAPIAPCWR